MLFSLNNSVESNQKNLPVDPLKHQKSFFKLILEEFQLINLSAPKPKSLDHLSPFPIVIYEGTCQ